MSQATLDNTARFSVADCGSSLPEARLKGCKFSPMVTSWTPTACLSSALDSEWNASGRKYFLDQNGTKEASHDAVTRGDVETYWIDMNTHVAHCVYAFRQIYHAYQQGKGLGAVPAHVMEEEHFYHCLTFMSTGNFSGDALVSVVHQSYTHC
jgi:hypothetical protein